MKTRAKKHDFYFYIDEELCVYLNIEIYTPMDNRRFAIGNYFLTREEAESAARKLRAVLNGADVIDTPSDKDIENAMKTSVTESIMSVAPLDSFTKRATDIVECAWTKGAEWVKSKIIK